jgi:hypothetical protein
MSSTSAPFGFRASYHNSGQMRPKAYVIASTYAANIFSGDPVKLTDAGVIQLGTSDGTRSGTVPTVFLCLASLQVASILMLVVSLQSLLSGLLARLVQRLWLGSMMIQKLCLTLSTQSGYTRAQPFKRLLAKSAIGLWPLRVVPPNRHF